MTLQLKLHLVILLFLFVAFINIDTLTTPNLYRFSFFFELYYLSQARQMRQQKKLYVSLVVEGEKHKSLESSNKTKKKLLRVLAEKEKKKKGKGKKGLLKGHFLVTKRSFFWFCWVF